MKMFLYGIVYIVLANIIIAASYIDISPMAIYNKHNTAYIVKTLEQLHKKNKFDKPYSVDDSLLITKIISASLKINFNEGAAECYDLLGVRERNKSNYAKALSFHKKAIELIGEDSKLKLKAIILNNIGVVYRRLDNFADAIQYHLKALAIAEQYNDIPTICVSLNSLGNIFMAQKKHETALRYFEQALSKEIGSHNLLGMAINYNNIGAIYLEEKKYDLSLEFMKKSLDCNMKINNQKGMAICYNDMGSLFLEQKLYNTALLYFNKALTMNFMLGDKMYISEAYINLGKVKRLTQKYDESLNNLCTGLKIAQSIRSINQSQTAYKELSNTYELIGDPDKALLNYKKYDLYKDSILNEEVNDAVNRMQVLYETGEKDKEIDFLKDKNLINSKKHKVIVASLIGGCFLLLVFLILIYLNFRLKQKVNMSLLVYNKDVDEKNRLLTIQKEEILAHRDDIERKSKEINYAYEQIKIKNTSITENIRYAFQIQSSLLPEPGYFNSLLNESFLLYKPKDIVSGDFNWVTEKNGIVIMVIGDCTGHGVSGAFMSILGITALNEIVIEKGVTDTAEILNLIREKIIWTLQQGGEFSETRDGIHMVVCALDKENKTMQFSGAMNSIIIVRRSALYIYKGDKMPVSIYPDMRNFTSTNIPLETNDMIYLYTDGYYGQFGGSEDRKFSVLRFRNLLKLIAPLSIDKQQKQLENVFASWMGDAEQVDDVLIMGVQIK